MTAASGATKRTVKRPRGRPRTKVVQAKRPRGRPALNDVLRPVCPEGHIGWKVQLAGTYAKSWGPHSRFRYRCVPPGWDAKRKRKRREGQAQLDDPTYLPAVLSEPIEVEPTDDPDWNLEDWLNEPKDHGPRPHTFIGTALSARHPTQDHPHGGEACEICEHEYRRNEGPNTGRMFLFSLREIAKALSNVAKGGTYRGSGKWIRSEAVRNKVDPESPASKERRERRKAAGLPTRPRKTRRYQRAVSGGDYSKESRLVAGYIDAFAPILLAGHEATTWPARIGLDSRPMKVPGVDQETGAPLPRGEALGEILCAVDLTTFPTRVIKMSVAGSKSGLSWLDFLQSIPTTTEPEVVVADRGAEIRWAVERVWPTTYQYACEGHLLKNARDAAIEDKAYKFLPNPDKPTESSKGPALWNKDVPDLAQSPLWLAMDRMLRSVERWDEFKQIVEALVPNDPAHQNLRRFIANAEQLVIDQIEYRALHPGTPQGAGAVETVFNDLDKWFSGRVFRNRRRLDLVLALIRLSKLGKAEERDLFQVLRHHFQSNNGRAGVVWTAMLDSKFDGSSIARLVSEARLRGALAEDARRTATSTDRQNRGHERAAAERAAAGLDPIGRKRRAEPPSYRRVAGMKVSDLPDVLEAWDWEANADSGLLPETTPAGSGKIVGWVCRGHEDQGHLHHYPRRISDRATDPGRMCPMCANKKICPSNNLAAQHPDIAAEWHPTKNKGLLPSQVFPAAPKKVHWLCRKCPRPHAYEQKIYQRTLMHQGCKKFKDREGAARIKEAMARQAAEKRQLGRALRAERDAAKARAAGEDFDEPLPFVPYRPIIDVDGLPDEDF